MRARVRFYGSRARPGERLELEGSFGAATEAAAGLVAVGDIRAALVVGQYTATRWYIEERAGGYRLLRHKVRDTARAEP